MIRVVVVEDSTTARTLLVSLLQSDPEIQVVGEAADGLEGVALTQKLRPDVVTMDIHMPRMNGLAATKEVMITVPTPIVIVTGSSVTGRTWVLLWNTPAGGRALPPCCTNQKGQGRRGSRRPLANCATRSRPWHRSRWCATGGAHRRRW